MTKPMTDSSIRCRLLAVHAENPDLTDNGVGTSARQLRRLYGNRSDSLEKTQAQYDQFRAGLVSDRNLVLAEQVHDWLLANVGKNKAARPGGPSSYWVKHVVENAIEVYVSNGTLILAAVAAGYPTWYDRMHSGPNVALGMSMRDLHRVAAVNVANGRPPRVRETKRRRGTDRPVSTR